MNIIIFGYKKYKNVISHTVDKMPKHKSMFFHRIIIQAKVSPCLYFFLAWFLFIGVAIHGMHSDDCEEFNLFAGKCRTPSLSNDASPSTSTFPAQALEKGICIACQFLSMCKSKSMSLSLPRLLFQNFFCTVHDRLKSLLFFQTANASTRAPPAGVC